MSSEIVALRDQVEAWIEYDPNPTSRAHVQNLWRTATATGVSSSAAALHELHSLFIPRIAFGTAGLRARMAPGPHHMNELIVLQTTQGLCRIIQSHFQSSSSTITNNDNNPGGVVIGYDGRHNSRAYAELAASIFLSQGLHVHFFSQLCPTPLVPFTIAQLGLWAGVMVTASHNPKDDNGYKVYWSNSAQIIPPLDQEIAQSIMTNQRPWQQHSYVFDANHPHLHDPLVPMRTQYMRLIREFYCHRPAQNAATALRVTYTAMHGVGAPWTAEALRVFDLPAYIPVAEQVVPDPEFPTVKFPNPEEGKGALALAMRTADANNSPLILANDPDADRLAIAEKHFATNEWVCLNGNQIALLFADWVWTTHKEKHAGEDLSKCLMVNSTVSSAILAAMARVEGFHHVDTLTGFKWMGNAVYDWEKRGYHFLFAFEVEIGFLVGNISLDKDGVRTAAIFNELAAAHYARGVTCLQHLETLYQRYGYFSMNTSYYFCYDSPTFDRVFNRLRTMNNGTYPTFVGGGGSEGDDAASRWDIVSVRDVPLGIDTALPGNKSALPRVTDSYMITFRFTRAHGTVTLRNSGTEPKLKYYVECSGSTREEADRACAELSRAALEFFLQPEANGLSKTPKA